MKKIRKKGGFILILLLVFVSIFSLVMLPFISSYNTTNNSLYKAEKKMQAINYAIEGLELTKGFFTTQQNINRVRAWTDVLQNLNGMYKISYANNQYILTQQNEEVIQQDFPYVIDYVRKISINNGETINEKNIKVEVDYGNNNIVLLQTTITNLYGDY